MNTPLLHQKLTQLQQLSTEITALLLQEDLQLAIVLESAMILYPMNPFSFTTELSAFVHDYQAKQGSIPYLVTGFDSKHHFTASLVYNKAQMEPLTKPPDGLPF
jgi:hypothetical protein